MSVQTPMLQTQPGSHDASAANAHGTNRNQSWYKKLCRPGTQLPPQDEQGLVQPSPQRLQLQMHFQREYQQRQELQKNCKQDWWQRKTGSTTPGPQASLSYHTPSPTQKVCPGVPGVFPDPLPYQRTPHPTVPGTIYQAGSSERELDVERRRLEGQLFDLEKRPEREKMIRAASMIKQDIERRVRESKRESVITSREQEVIQRKMILQALKEQEMAEKVRASNQNLQSLRLMTNANPEFQHRLASVIQTSAPQPFAIQQNWQDQVAMYNNMLQSYRQGNAQQSYQQAKLLQEMLQREAGTYQRRSSVDFQPATQQQAFYHPPQHTNSAEDDSAFRVTYIEQPGQSRRDPRLNRSSQLYQTHAYNITPRLNQSSRQYSEQELDTTIEILQPSVAPGIQDRSRRNSTPRKQAEKENLVRDENANLVLQQDETRRYEQENERSAEKPVTQKEPKKVTKPQGQQTEDQGLQVTFTSTGCEQDETQNQNTSARSEPGGRLLDWEQMQQRSQRHRRRRGMRFGNDEQNTSKVRQKDHEEERKNQQHKRSPPTSKYADGSVNRQTEKPNSSALSISSKSNQEKRGKQKFYSPVESPDNESPALNGADTDGMSANNKQVTERDKTMAPLPEKEMNDHTAKETDSDANRHSDQAFCEKNAAALGNNLILLDESVKKGRSSTHLKYGEGKPGSKLPPDVHVGDGCISADKLRSPVKSSSGEISKQVSFDASKQAPNSTIANGLDEQTTSVIAQGHKSASEHVEQIRDQATVTDKSILSQPHRDLEHPVLDSKGRPKDSLKLSCQNETTVPCFASIPQVQEPQSKLQPSAVCPLPVHEAKSHPAIGDEVHPSVTHLASQNKPPPPKTTQQPPRINRQQSQEAQRSADVTSQLSRGSRATPLQPHGTKRRQDPRPAPRNERTGVGKSSQKAEESRPSRTESVSKSPGSTSKPSGKKSPGSTYIVRNSAPRSVSLKAQTDPVNDGSEKSKSPDNTSWRSETSSPTKSGASKPPSGADKEASPPGPKSRRHRGRRRPWQREESFTSKEKTGSSAPRVQHRPKPRSLDRDQPLSWRSSSPRRLPPRRQADWNAQPRRRPYQWEESSAGPSKKWRTADQQSGSATVRVHPYRQPGQLEGRKKYAAERSVKSAHKPDQSDTGKQAQKQLGMPNETLQINEAVKENSATDSKLDMPERAFTSEKASTLHEPIAAGKAKNPRTASGTCEERPVGEQLDSEMDKIEDKITQANKNQTVQAQANTVTNDSQVSNEHCDGQEKYLKACSEHVCAEEKHHGQQTRVELENGRNETSLPAAGLDEAGNGKFGAVTAAAFEKQTAETDTKFPCKLEGDDTGLEDETETQNIAEEVKTQTGLNTGQEQTSGTDGVLEVEPPATCQWQSEEKAETLLEHVLLVLGKKGRGDDYEVEVDDNDKKSCLQSHRLQLPEEQSEAICEARETARGNHGPSEEPQAVQQAAIAERTEHEEVSEEVTEQRPSSTSSGSPPTAKILCLEEMEDWLVLGCPTKGDKVQETSQQNDLSEKKVSYAQRDEVLKEQLDHGHLEDHVYSKQDPTTVDSVSHTDNGFEQDRHPERLDSCEDYANTVTITKSGNTNEEQQQQTPRDIGKNKDSYSPDSIVMAASEPGYLKEGTVQQWSGASKACEAFPGNELSIDSHKQCLQVEQAEADLTMDTNSEHQVTSSEEQTFACDTGHMIAEDQQHLEEVPVQLEVPLSNGYKITTVAIDTTAHQQPQQPDNNPSDYKLSNIVQAQGDSPAFYTAKIKTVDVDPVPGMGTDLTAVSPNSETSFIGHSTLESCEASENPATKHSQENSNDKQQQPNSSHDKVGDILERNGESQSITNTSADGVSQDCSSEDKMAKVGDLTSNKIASSVEQSLQKRCENESIDAHEQQISNDLSRQICGGPEQAWGCRFPRDRSSGETGYVLIDRLTASGYI